MASIGDMAAAADSGATTLTRITEEHLRAAKRYMIYEHYSVPYTGKRASWWERLLLATWHNHGVGTYSCTEDDLSTDADASTDDGRGVDVDAAASELEAGMAAPEGGGAKKHTATFKRSHGELHANACAELIPEIYEIYFKHFPDMKNWIVAVGRAAGFTDSYGNGIFEYIRHLEQMTAYAHDSGRDGEGPDLWNDVSARNLEIYLEKNHSNLPKWLRKLLVLSIEYKNPKQRATSDDGPRTFVEAVEKLQGEEVIPETVRVALNGGDGKWAERLDMIFRQPVNIADTTEVMRCRSEWNPQYLALPPAKKGDMLGEFIDLAQRHRQRIVVEGRMSYVSGKIKGLDGQYDAGVSWKDRFPNKRKLAAARIKLHRNLGYDQDTSEPKDPAVIELEIKGKFEWETHAQTGEDKDGLWAKANVQRICHQSYAGSDVTFAPAFDVIAKVISGLPSSNYEDNVNNLVDEIKDGRLFFSFGKKALSGKQVVELLQSITESSVDDDHKTKLIRALLGKQNVFYKAIKFDEQDRINLAVLAGRYKLINDVIAKNQGLLGKICTDVSRSLMSALWLQFNRLGHDLKKDSASIAVRENQLKMITRDLTKIYFALQSPAVCEKFIAKFGKEVFVRNVLNTLKLLSVGIVKSKSEGKDAEETALKSIRTLFVNFLEKMQRARPGGIAIMDEIKDFIWSDGKRRIGKEELESMGIVAVTGFTTAEEIVGGGDDAPTISTPRPPKIRSSSLQTLEVDEDSVSYLGLLRSLDVRPTTSTLGGGAAAAADAATEATATQITFWSDDRHYNFQEVVVSSGCIVRRCSS